LKETKDLVLTFSKLYLSGEGDTVRHLAVLGINVSYSQSWLEVCTFLLSDIPSDDMFQEFDYHVTNLASDLRDGVRLARLLEVLTNGKLHLSSQMRVCLPI
jgi:abnormal spindle-like microcephaly-associated protein